MSDTWLGFVMNACVAICAIAGTSVLVAFCYVRVDKFIRSAREN